jgi:hypothetical protein
LRSFREYERSSIFEALEAGLQVDEKHACRRASRRPRALRNSTRLVRFLAVLSLGLGLAPTALAAPAAPKAPIEERPGQLSAQEAARELANPNTPLANLTLRSQFRSYDGDLPSAGDKEGFTMLFQPVFPLPLSNGAKVFFRPAIPLLIEQPYFDGSSLNFKSKTGLGDISFDLSYGQTLKSGLLYSLGLVSSLPTATSDDLGTERWTLGPEAFLGYLSEKFVGGVFPNHQWDIAGSGNLDISLTTVQAFGIYLPGGGWSVGTIPIMSYDWESEDWSVPLNVTGGRTLILGGRPWRFGLEINYYVERQDAFGPKWMIGFNVTPVVKNVAATWFR